MLTSLVRAFGIDNAFTTEDDNHADLFKKDWSCRQMSGNVTVDVQREDRERKALPI